MDTVTKEQRSWNMGKIRSEDTTPEIVVRSFLFRHGFRYRLHVKTLPGKPDIVLRKYRTVIDVRGCFWHRHKFCRYASTPQSHQEYWLPKFERNIKRDVETEHLLKMQGWNVIILWECQIKNEKYKDLLAPLLASKF